MSTEKKKHNDNSVVEIELRIPLRVKIISTMVTGFFNFVYLGMFGYFASKWNLNTNSVMDVIIDIIFVGIPLVLSWEVLHWILTTKHVCGPISHHTEEIEQWRRDHDQATYR